MQYNLNSEGCTGKFSIIVHIVYMYSTLFLPTTSLPITDIIHILLMGEDLMENSKHCEHFESLPKAIQNSISKHITLHFMLFFQ